MPAFFNHLFKNTAFPNSDFLKTPNCAIYFLIFLVFQNKFQTMLKKKNKKHPNSIVHFLIACNNINLINSSYHDGLWIFILFSSHPFFLAFFFPFRLFRSKTFLHSCALYYFFVLINIQPTLILDWIFCVFIDEYKLVFRSIFLWIFYLCFLEFNYIDVSRSDTFRNKVI